MGKEQAFRPSQERKSPSSLRRILRNSVMHYVLQGTFLGAIVSFLPYLHMGATKHAGRANEMAERNKRREKQANGENGIGVPTDEEKQRRNDLKIQRPKGVSKTQMKKRLKMNK